MFDFAHAGLVILCGTGVGFISGFFAISGGVVSVPLLTLFFGLDQHFAQGTSLLFGSVNLLNSINGYRKKHPLIFKDFFVNGASSAIVALIFSYFALQIQGRYLAIGFIVLLLFLAILLTLLLVKKTPLNNSHLKFWQIVKVSGVGGAISGLFGGGAGPVTTPLFVLLYKVSQLKAQLLTITSIWLGVIIAFVSYASSGKVLWDYGIELCLGSFIGVPIGVKLAHKVSEKKLRISFIVLLVVIALTAALKTFTKTN